MNNNNLTFAAAYAAMKAGAKVHRAGHKGYWGFDKDKGEYIYLPEKDKEISYGKLELTIKDCASNDWEILDGFVGEYEFSPETSNGVSFNEAYKAMKTGRKIRREGFKGFWAISDETGEVYIELPNGKHIQYGKLGQTMRSCASNDWIIE